MAKAALAWGSPLPDWIRALAEACDDAGLRATAGKLNVSPAMLSLAIGRKRANLDWIKGKVERLLLVSMVACPALGVMSKDECLQKQAMPYSNANPLRMQLYRACRSGCPHFREANRKADETKPK
jgi:hypothetical protein